MVHEPTQDVLLEFCLDFPVPEFRKRESRFIDDLAGLMGVEPSALVIISVRHGCTYVVVRIPGNAAKALLDDYKGELTGERSTVLKELLSNHSVRWIRAANDVQAAMIAEIFAEKPEGPTFTWFHLSDLHMHAVDGAAKFNQEILLESLTKDLPALLEKRQLTPDVLFFTGDLAFSGEPNEYRAVKDFLERVFRTLPKPPKIYTVPGNHDVQWKEIEVDLEKALRSQVKTEEDIDKLILEPSRADDRAKIFRRLSNYESFITDINSLGQPELNRNYFYTDVTTFSGYSIGVAGLNSAWRCNRKDRASGLDVDIDTGHLLLGKPQLYRAVKDLESADVRFALVHHPPLTAWYSQADYETQKAYLTSFDFLLRGHEHMEHPIRIGNLHTADDALHLAAGALYEGGRAPLSVGLGRMDFSTGTISLYFVNYSYKHRRWLYDSNPFWPLGCISLAFPLRIRKELAVTVKRPTTSIESLVSASKLGTTIPETEPQRV